MRRRTAAVLIVAALTLGGCSSPDDSPPAKSTATVTKTTAPKLSATEQRAACVDAWAGLLQGDADLGVEDAPSECATVPDGDQLDVYMEGLQERNARARASFDACTDDASLCTVEP